MTILKALSNPLELTKIGIYLVKKITGGIGSLIAILPQVQHVWFMQL